MWFNPLLRYNGFFYTACGDACANENTYVNTCVQHTETAEAPCYDEVGFCGGEGV